MHRHRFEPFKAGPIDLLFSSPQVERDFAALLKEDYNATLSAMATMPSAFLDIFRSRSMKPDKLIVSVTGRQDGHGTRLEVLREAMSIAREFVTRRRAGEVSVSLGDTRATVNHVLAPEPKAKRGRRRDRDND